MGHFRARVSRCGDGATGKVDGHARPVGPVGDVDGWVGVEKGERQRRRRRCQQVHRGGWDEKRYLVLIWGQVLFLLVLVGIGDGTRQRFRHLPWQAGVYAWLVRALTWAREWAWHGTTTTVAFVMSSSKRTRHGGLKTRTTRCIF